MYFKRNLLEKHFSAIIPKLSNILLSTVGSPWFPIVFCPSMGQLTPIDFPVSCGVSSLLTYFLLFCPLQWPYLSFFTTQMSDFIARLFYAAVIWLKLEFLSRGSPIQIILSTYVLLIAQWTSAKEYFSFFKMDRACPELLIVIARWFICIILAVPFCHCYMIDMIVKPWDLYLKLPQWRYIYLTSSLQVCQLRKIFFKWTLNVRIWKWCTV